MSTHEPEVEVTVEALRASELRYRRLFESAKDGILILDAETGMIVDVNAFLLGLLGISREACLGKKVWELGFFNDIAANQDKFAELQAQEYIRYKDLPLEAADGRPIAVEFVSNLYLVNDRRVIQCTIRDITDRKREEEKIQEREETYSTLIAQASDSIALVDSRSGRFVEFNLAAHRDLGYTREEFEKLTVADIDTRITPENFKDLLGATFQKGSDVFERQHRHKSGQRIDVRVSVKSLHLRGREYFAAIWSDITERKQAEHALAERESRLRALFDNAGYSVSVAKSGVQIMGNPAFVALFGYKDAAELVGRPVIETIAPEERDWISKRMADRLRGVVVPPLFETKGLRRDGTIFDMEVMVSTYVSNNEVYTVGFQRDITDRKLAEKALRESEARLRAILDATPFPVALVDVQDNNIDFWSRSALALFGHVAPTAMEWYELAYPDPDYRREVIEQWKPLLEKARQSGQVIDTGIYRVTCSNGSVRLCELYAAFVADRLVVTFDDITERKRAEAELNRFFDLAPDLVCIASTDGFFKKINRTWEIVLGYSQTELLATPFVDLIHPDDVSATLAEVEKQIAGGGTAGFANRYRCKDGSYRWLEWLATPAVNRTLLFATARDITMRKRLEAYGEMGREILQIINESGDLRESIQRVIARLKKWTGFDAVGIRLQDGDDFPYYAQKGFPKNFLSTENTLVARDPSGGLCRTEDGNICLECTCGLVISGKTDRDNPLFTRGGSFYTNDSLLLLDVPPGEDPRLHPRNQCIHQGYASVALVPIRSQNSNVGLIQLNDRRKGCFTLQEIELLEGIASHIGTTLIRRRAEEEKKKLEAQLQHAQKLESLGVLAGGIAHDFNNILQGILGNATLVLMDLAESSSTRVCAEDILKASRRAADLTRQLLAYSGKGHFIIQQVEVSALVREMAKLIAVSISKKTVLKLNLAPVSITADIAQIQQIVMNLILNASEALDEERGGNVTLATGVQTCTRDYLKHSRLPEKPPPGKYGYIDVSDTGCGMDETTLEKLFDPFFTTKFTGRGLGMSAVLGIVRGHKGGIMIDSMPGKGTTIRVLFPASAKPAAQKKTQTRLGAAWKGTGTVLFVDDEDAVRSLGKLMLERLGFKVKVAANGREALRLYQKYSSEIVCVILDLSMPHMDGEQTLRQLRLSQHDVPVVLSSGFSEIQLKERLAGQQVSAFIKKPYDFQSLSDLLESILS